MSKSTTEVLKDRHFWTYAKTVVIPYGARHIDNGINTACGIDYDETAHHSGGTGTKTRISCGYCARGTDYPQ